MTTPTQSQDELKQNYCFWCSSYGSTNWPLCVNCGNKIGSVPPEVQAHIDKAVAVAWVEGAIAESKMSETFIHRNWETTKQLQSLDKRLADLQSQRVALVGEDKPNE